MELPRQSENVTDLIKSLIKAKGEFRSVYKEKKNSNIGYKYSSLENIFAMTDPVLLSNDMTIVQATEPRDGDQFIRTSLYHSSGQWITSYLKIVPEPAVLRKGEVPTSVPKPVTNQDIGKSLTYMRRYAVMSLLGISFSDEEDDCQRDDDTPTSSKEMRPLSSKSEDIRKPESGLLVALKNAMGSDVVFMDKMLKVYGVSSIEELNRGQAEMMLNSAKQRNDK